MQTTPFGLPFAEDTPVNYVDYYHLDGTPVKDRIISIGGTGCVIENGQHAVKIPRIVRDVEFNSDGRLVLRRPFLPAPGEYDNRPPMIHAMTEEKKILRRLGDHPGIIRCHDLWSEDLSIRMDLMKNGDVKHYLAETTPDRKMQYSWLVQMAHTLQYVHDCSVLYTDYRTDNLLLDDDFSIKLADFGNSELMPEGADLDNTGDLEYTRMIDLGQFGAAMYEIITGKHISFNLFTVEAEDGELSPLTFPSRDFLPPTKDVWLGHIIEKCWNQQFKTAADIAKELEMQTVE